MKGWFWFADFSYFICRYQNHSGLGKRWSILRKNQGLAAACLFQLVRNALTTFELAAGGCGNSSLHLETCVFSCFVSGQHSASSPILVSLPWRDLGNIQGHQAGKHSQNALQVCRGPGSHNGWRSRRQAAVRGNAGGVSACADVSAHGSQLLLSRSTGLKCLDTSLCS